jgi:glyoxylase-like metal-dependent hydrolase (beta-lactamase superfamily II)
MASSKIPGRSSGTACGAFRAGLPSWTNIGGETMKRTIVMLLALEGAGLNPTSGLAFQPLPEEALAPYTARELRPGVHLLATPPDYLGGVIGNIIIVEQSDGFVVIDSGQTAADGRRAAAYVRSLGDKPVKALVYTHWHGDHPQGGSEIKAAWPGARIISTARTAESLRTQAVRYVGLQPDIRFDAIFRQQVEGLHRQIDEQLKNSAHDSATRGRYERMRRESAARIADFTGTSLALPTETFKDRLLLADPIRPVELVYPGRANTDGDAVAWLPKERILVTGDIVVSPVPFGFFSFPAEWIKVLRRFKGMDYSILVPGHGEPQTDTVYLDRLIATISDIRGKVAPLARRGLKPAEIRKRVDYSAQEAIFGDTPRHKLQFDAFWLTPMTVNAWYEARGLPMVQGKEDIYP